MPDRPLLKPSTYGVYSEGPIVKLQVGNSILPMTWDVAVRMGARVRVHLRSAKNYRGASRELPQLSEAGGGNLRRAIREVSVIGERQYKVFAEGPDVIIEVGNSRLTMTPEVARNVSLWLTKEGWKVRDEYHPDLELRFSIAHLTDAVAEAKLKQSRRDPTAALL